MTGGYLGIRPRTLAAMVAAAIAAAVIVTPHLPTPGYAGCTLVQDGPTGPERDVTLGLAIYACPDRVLHVTYVLGTAEVVEVERLQPAPCGYVVESAEVVPAACSTAAELDARMTAIRATRSGGRW
jgi:hypothetical protein